ncbi:MAG: histone deacetylase [Spirochaetaceae bacterium]
MVLYDPLSHISLLDYGILIPVAPDRSARVVSELEVRLAARGVSRDQWLVLPDPVEMKLDDILRAHSAEYTGRLYGTGLEQAILEAFELIDDQGRPYRYAPQQAVKTMSELFTAFLQWCARSYQAGVEAISGDARYCYHLGGGGHHGHYDFGHGFCVVNDIVVAIRKLQADNGVRNAWVIDLDAHKGDGTAALTDGDDSIITLSIHMASGWPLDLPDTCADGKPHPSYVQSNYDIPIAAGEEHEYLPRLESGLAALGALGKPDIAYVIGGVDPYEHDGLPSTQDLRLTIDQLITRDRMTFDFLRERDIPQAWLMAGGYGERAWEPYVPSIEYAVVRSLGLSL